MKALVTGANGFIGSTLIQELDTLGFEVRALLRKSSVLSPLIGLKVQHLEGDLSDFDSLCRAVKGVDYIFHLAGLSQAKSRAGFIECNARGTERLARAVAKTKTSLSRFVYLSSLAAAGPAQSLKPKLENEKPQPVSAFGESKLLGEKELLKYQNIFPLAIVRPSIVYGPRDKLFFLMIKTVARNLIPMIQGNTQNGHKYYSTIHAEDLCRGLAQVALASRERVPSGEIFYLTSDDIHTYQDLVEVIAEKLNLDPLRVRIPKIAMTCAATSLGFLDKISRHSLPFHWDKLNELIPDYWICSNQKAKKILGFRPEFDLGTGLAHAIDWYKSQRWI